MLEQEKLFYRMVETDSTNNTPGEIEMANLLFEIIKEHSYFQEHPDLCGLEDIPDDSQKRKYPWALYLSKSETSKTVVLTGHFDTVSDDNYDLLKPYARHPDELREQMKSKAFSAEVQKDLQSEQWIFGRGTADMKGGLSVLMTQFFSALEGNDPQINLLLLPVPDEEGYSVGIRGSVSLMLHLKKLYSLEFLLLITSESHIRTDGKMLCSAGVVGKVQINIVTAGIPAHIRNYYAGCNPIQMSARIAAAIDGNAELCEQYGDQKTLPPILMYFRDTKEHYDVTLPSHVDLSLTCQIYRRSPEAMLQLIREKISQALLENEVTLKQRYETWIDGYTAAVKLQEQKAKVVSFQELLDMARAKGGQAFELYYEQEKRKILEQRHANLLSYSNATLKLMHVVIDYVAPIYPLVVVALAPPLYPGFTNSQILPEDHPILNLPNHVSAFTKEEFGIETRIERFFSGISDMSYAATTYSTAEIDMIKENMPIWGEDYHINFGEIRELQIPVMNIGPWGKDIHTGTERVNKQSLLNENGKILQYVLKIISEGEATS